MRSPWWIGWVCTLCLLLTAHPTSSQQFIYEGDCQLNLIFLVDASISLGNANYRTSLQTVINFIRNLPVAEEAVHVGVVAFSVTTSVVDLSGNLDDVIQGIRDLPYYGRYINTHRAFQAARNMFQLTERVDAPNVVVLITDGPARRPADAIQQAKILRDEGVTIFAIGIGGRVNIIELLDYAGDIQNIGIGRSFASFPSVIDLPLACDVIPVPTSSSSALATTSVVESTQVVSTSKPTSQVQPSSTQDVGMTTKSSQVQPSSTQDVGMTTKSSQVQPSSTQDVGMTTKSSQVQPSSTQDVGMTTKSSQVQPASTQDVAMTTKSSQVQPSSTQDVGMTTKSSQVQPSSTQDVGMTTKSSQVQSSSTQDVGMTTKSSQVQPSSTQDVGFTTKSSQVQPSSTQDVGMTTKSSQVQPSSTQDVGMTTKSSQVQSSSTQDVGMTTKSSQVQPSSTQDVGMTTKSSQVQPSSTQDVGMTTKSSQVQPSSTQDVGHTETSKLQPSSTQDVGHTETSKVQLSSTQDVGHTETSKVQLSSTQDVGHTETSKLQPSSTQDVGHTETSKLQHSSTQDVGHTETSKVQLSSTQDVGHTETSKLQPSSTQDVGHTETSKVQHSSTQDVGHTETSKLQPSSTQDVGHTETSKLQPSSTQDVGHTETSKLQPSSTQDVGHTETSKLQPTPTEDTGNSQTPSLDLSHTEIFQTTQSRTRPLSTTISGPTDTSSHVVSSIDVTSVSPEPSQSVTPGPGPFQEKTDSRICSDAVEMDGAWVTSHPRDCDKFLQCHVQAEDRVVTAVRLCPRGQFWSRKRSMCMDPAKADCSMDMCKDRTVDSYSMDGGCGLYWRCQRGVSHGESCKPGHAYSNLEGCIQSSKCKTVSMAGACDNEDVCQRVPLPGNRAYQTKLEAYPGEWMTTPCLYGATFDLASCSCVASRPFSSDCQHIKKVERHLTPIPNQTNSRQNSTRLVLDPRSSRPMTLRFRYIPSSSPETKGEILLRSSQCQTGGLFVLWEEDDYLEARVFAGDGVYMKSSLPLRGLNETDWRTVNIRYTFNGDLSLKVTSGRLTFTSYVPGGLYVPLSLCGWDAGLPGSLAEQVSPFTGEMEEIYISRCYDHGF